MLEMVKFEEGKNLLDIVLCREIRGLLLFHSDERYLFNSELCSSLMSFEDSIIGAWYVEGEENEEKVKVGLK